MTAVPLVPRARPDAASISVTVEWTPGRTGLSDAEELAEQLRSYANQLAPGSAVSSSVSLVLGRTGSTLAAPIPLRPRRPAPVRINPSRRTVSIDDADREFTRREYDLLTYLASRPGRVLRRTQLLEDVWGTTVETGERTVDVHVRRVRAKLGRYANTLVTLRGVGYRLDGADTVEIVA